MAAEVPEADALLVAIGAVPGAWLRFRVVDHLEPVLPSRHWGTFGVNVIACFALGLIVGLEQSCGEASRRALLLVGTGFCGALTTFCTWMLDLARALQTGKPGESALLLLASLAGGVALVALGHTIGMFLSPRLRDRAAIPKNQ